MLKIDKYASMWAINDEQKLVFTAVLENGEKKTFVMSATEIKEEDEVEEPVVIPTPIVVPDDEEDVKPKPDTTPEADGNTSGDEEEEPIEPSDEDEDMNEEKEEEAKKDEYIVWVKDSLWGKDYEKSADVWTWSRPTEHSYNVYVEGPAGSKIYPKIERFGKIYETKEDLTNRGPRIAFNRIQNIPMTLQGLGTKTLIGTDLGPGSSSAKGYNGYLILENEKGEVIKRINMKYI